ncbi:hypothetical protein Ddye_029321 [Dipteronia dyeriana]|uniref:Peptidase S8/S53 domain-containing protein n=1 Tax=Dipteronia dyeriana TaxID=168575 RepID=A0AAD9WKH0_9ROSI|nr:hypothetical protein Ddye_029321 [Dipteronia dyeriana]
MTTDSGPPRDQIGHWTHMAATAAGSHVRNVGYYGLARDRARGGSPSSRIASYKACSEDGCSGSTILMAIEDAIKDGVDMISISIGMSAIFQEDFLSDPIVIGAFHVDQMGVMVVCSAGNNGLIFPPLSIQLHGCLMLLFPLLIENSNLLCFLAVARLFQVLAFISQICPAQRLTP